jgi:hypothetical protein
LLHVSERLRMRRAGIETSASLLLLLLLQV